MGATAIAAIVLLWAVLSAAAQPAQVPQAGSRVTLRGVLVEAGRGAPLGKARVNVSSGRTSVASVLTDREGRFSVAVAPGTALLVRIVKAGYASIEVPVSAQPLRVSDPLRIEVPRGAVIAGRAIDGSGQPAQMVVIRRQTSDGTVWSTHPGAVVAVRQASDGTVSSTLGSDGLFTLKNLATVSPDERGEYRVGSLPPGRYVVEAYPAGSAYVIDGSSGRQTFRLVGVGSPVPPTSVTLDLQAGSEAGADLLLERPTSPAPAEPGPERPGSTIRGVVSTTDGAPLANATVRASRSGVAEARNASTDTFGRFTLRGIDPGAVSVRATKRGYAESQPGQRGGGLPALPVKVEAGKDVDNLSIVLPRTGAINGVVIDEQGEPLQEAGLQLLRVRREASGELVGLSEQSASLRRMTDDRGQFRVWDIAPGDYVVMASLPAETPDAAAALRTAYLPAYYPDTHDFASASAIRIMDGEVVPGLTLTMRRVPVVRVAGVAHNSQGTPFTGTVRLTQRRPAPPLASERVVTPGPGGEFVFADVLPGGYLLRALVPSGPGGSELAVRPVTVVDRDPEPVTIRTSPGSRVSGRIVLEGGSGQEERRQDVPGDQVLWGYSATSVPFDSASSPVGRSNLGAPITTSEPFTLDALVGLSRVRFWSDDQNWYLKSIFIDGVDIADAPFDFGFDGRPYADVEVVFSRRGATITGRATDERAAPVRDYAVYVFSTDRDKWFDNSRWVRLARAAADGTFTASAMPPGDYWIVAVDRVDASSAPDWMDTGLLTMLSSRATRVTLGEGQSQTVSLRMINQ